MNTVFSCGYILTRAGYAFEALRDAHRVVEKSVHPEEQRFIDEDIAGFMFKALLWSGRTGLWDTRCPDCQCDGHTHTTGCPSEPRS